MIKLHCMEHFMAWIEVKEQRGRCWKCFNQEIIKCNFDFQSDYQGLRKEIQRTQERDEIDSWSAY